MLHIFAVRIPLGESCSYFECILDLSSIPRGTFVNAGCEMLFGKSQNALFIYLKALVSFFEELDVDFPDLFGLLLVQLWIVGDPSDSRLDCIIQYSNPVCCEEQDTGVELQDSQKDSKTLASRLLPARI
jgi:hypothetical protein